MARTDKAHEQMLRHVQFLAVGTVVELLLAAHFSRFPDPAKAADDMLGLAEKVSDRMTFPDVDAALSDLAAQEFRDSLVRHIHRSRALATGTPFDPSAFRKRAPDPGA
jgi:hypothetical protein